MDRDSSLKEKKCIVYLNLCIIYVVNVRVYLPDTGAGIITNFTTTYLFILMLSLNYYGMITVKK